MTHSVLLLVLDGLAVYRATHLLVDDAITASLRMAFVRAGDWGRDFITCPWCVSIWVGALVVLLQTVAPGPWFYASCVLAFSAVAGVLSELL